MQAELKDGNIVITVPLKEQPFPLSSTQKSYIVASSGGNITTDIVIGGKPVKIGVNCFQDAR